MRLLCSSSSSSNSTREDNIFTGSYVPDDCANYRHVTAGGRDFFCEELFDEHCNLPVLVTPPSRKTIRGSVINAAFNHPQSVRPNACRLLDSFYSESLSCKLMLTSSVV